MQSWREQQDGASPSEKVGREDKEKGCPLCEGAAQVYGALLRDECPAVGEPVCQEQAGKADTVVGCCYRPCGYGEEMHRDFFKLGGISGHIP